MNNQEFIFECRIKCNSENSPNPVHLCQAIQEHIQSVNWYNTGVNAEVVGYNVEINPFIPFEAIND
tara:strand:- start:673 stop:870 length:198 start_codon:yes stop_codon:yes gene_type:complete